MRFIIRLAESFDSLRSSREYMFEQPPMGGAADETLAQHDEGREMSYCVGGKMVKLRPKVVHYTFEEGMRRQRETSVHVAEQQDALPLPGRRLGLAFRRQPPRLVRNHSVLHQLKSEAKRS